MRVRVPRPLATAALLAAATAVLWPSPALGLDAVWPTDVNAAGHRLKGLAAPGAGADALRLQDIAVGSCLLKGTGVNVPTFVCAVAGTDYQSALTSPDASILFPSLSTVRLRDVAGLSVMGRAGGSSGVAQDITATADGQFLQRLAGALAWASTLPGASVTGTPNTPTWFNGAGALASLALGPELSLNTGTGTLFVPSNGLGLAKIAQGAPASIVGVAGSSTANHADVPVTGGNQVPISNAAGTSWSWGAVPLSATSGIVASWGVPGSTRWYCVSYDHGNDANVGYSDVSAADCGTKFVKTWTQLLAILPSAGAGRQVQIIYESRASGVMYLKPDGATNEPFALSGLTGYQSVTARATVTDATAGSVAFAGDAADLALGGAIRASGTNTGGYNVTSSPSTFVINVQLAGGGAAGLPTESSNGISAITGYRVRFGNSTTTSALRNASTTILSNASGQITFASALPATPVSSDVFYIDAPGAQFASISTQGCFNRTLSIAGINTPGIVSVSNGSINTALAFLAAGSSSVATALTTSSPVSLSKSRYRNGINISATTSTISAIAVDYGAPASSSTLAFSGSVSASTFGSQVSAQNAQFTAGASSAQGVNGMSGGGPIFIGSMGIASVNRVRIVDPGNPLNALGALSVYSDAVIWGVDITTTGGNFTSNAVKNGISVIGNGLRVSVDDAVGSVDGVGLAISGSSHGSQIRVGYNAANTLTSHNQWVTDTGLVADFSFGLTTMTYAQLGRTGYTDGSGNHVSAPITSPSAGSYGFNTPVAFTFGAVTAMQPYIVVRQDPLTPNHVIPAKADSASDASGILGVTQNAIGGSSISNLGPSITTGVSVATTDLMWIKYDSTPTVGNIGYLSDTGSGTARDTPPTAPGTVVIPLGVCTAIDGTLCMVKFSLPSLNYLADPGSNGIVVRTAAATTAARTIQPGTGIGVTNGDGVAGDPVITNTSPLSSLTASDGTLVISGTNIRRAAVTGPVGIAGGSNTSTLNLSAGSGISGQLPIANEGAPTSTGFGHVTAGVWDGAARAVDLSSADATGILATGRFPALTGPVTTVAGALATSLNVGAGGVSGALPLGNQAAPTGTGFPHVTGSAWDGAARSVNLATADVTGLLPAANVAPSLVNGQTLTTLGGVSTWTSPSAAGADALGTYVVTSSSHAPANAFNLGALSNGLLKCSVTTGVCTPSIAAAGVDYQSPITWPALGQVAVGAGATTSPAGFSGLQYDGTKLIDSSASDVTVAEFTSGSTGLNPQVRIISTNASGKSTINFLSNTSTLEGVIRADAGGSLSLSSGAGGLGLFVGNFGTQAASISSGGVVSLPIGLSIASLNGMLKATSGSVGVATSGTDYVHSVNVTSGQIANTGTAADPVLGLPSVGSSGSCTFCSVTFDGNGRETAKSSASFPSGVLKGSGASVVTATNAWGADYINKAYTTVMSGSTAEPQEQNLAFDNSAFAVSDFPSGSRTDVTLTTLDTPGSGNVFNVNAQGRITGYSTQPYLTSAFYQTMMAGNVAQAQRQNLGFDTTYFGISDFNSGVPSTSRTDVTLVNNSVSNAKIRQSVARSVVGNAGSSTANVADISTTSGSHAVLVESLGTLVFGQVDSLGLTNNAVNYANIQNETASTLLGNPTGSLRVPEEITLGSGLLFSGTTLQVTPQATNTFTFAIGGPNADISLPQGGISPFPDFWLRPMSYPLSTTSPGFEQFQQIWEYDSGDSYGHIDLFAYVYSCGITVAAGGQDDLVFEVTKNGARTGKRFTAACPNTIQSNTQYSTVSQVLSLSSTDRVGVEVYDTGGGTYQSGALRATVTLRLRP